MENTLTINVSVPGRPIALSRPRFKRIGRGVMCYNPQATQEIDFKKVFKNHISADVATKLHEIVSSDTEYYVSLSCIFNIPVPKNTSKKNKALAISEKIKPTTRPDIDNYAKFVLDALHDVVYDDDNRVTDLTCKKRYSEEGNTDILITIEY